MNFIVNYCIELINAIYATSFDRFMHVLIRNDMPIFAMHFDRTKAFPLNPTRSNYFFWISKSILLGAIATNNIFTFWSLSLMRALLNKTKCDKVILCPFEIAMGEKRLFIKCFDHNTIHGIDYAFNGLSAFICWWMIQINVYPRRLLTVAWFFFSVANFAKFQIGF